MFSSCSCLLCVRPLLSLFIFHFPFPLFLFSCSCPCFYFPRFVHSSSCFVSPTCSCCSSNSFFCIVILRTVNIRWIPFTVHRYRRAEGSILLPFLQLLLVRSNINVYQFTLESSMYKILLQLVHALNIQL